MTGLVSALPILLFSSSLVVEQAVVTALDRELNVVLKKLDANPDFTRLNADSWLKK